jgi:hypothetical protein
MMMISSAYTSAFAALHAVSTVLHHVTLPLGTVVLISACATPDSLDMCGWQDWCLTFALSIAQADCRRTCQM